MLPCQGEGALTDNQRDALNSLVCERISDRGHDKENRAILEAFECPCDRYGKPRNPKVLHHLQDTNDRRSETAVYIIKTKDGTGLLAFSLKCGEIFFPVCKDEKAYKEFCHAEFLERQTRLGIPEEYAEKLFRQTWEQEYDTKIAKWKRKYSEWPHGHEGDAGAGLRGQNDTGKSIDKSHYVSETFSGIQMVDFFRNADSKTNDFWNRFSPNNDWHGRCGSVLFWNKIAPVVCAVNKRVGCEYLYLFAADQWIEKSLVEYYKTHLGFKENPFLGANRPPYDWEHCWLMSQRVAEMDASREAFFANFNAPQNESVENEREAWTNPNIK